MAPFFIHDLLVVKNGTASELDQKSSYLGTRRLSFVINPNSENEGLGELRKGALWRLKRGRGDAKRHHL